MVSDGTALEQHSICPTDGPSCHATLSSSKTFLEHPLTIRNQLRTNVICAMYCANTHCKSQQKYHNDAFLYASKIGLRQKWSSYTALPLVTQGGYAILWR